MKRLLVFVLCAGAVLCESFIVQPRETFKVGLRLDQGVNTQISMEIEGSTAERNKIELADPSGTVVKKFKDESTVGLSFLPALSGDYYLNVVNLSSQPFQFILSLPITNEGPFPSKAEMDLGVELEMLLKNIIKSQKTLLYRQHQHLEQAKATKSWIRKLTVLEVVLCLLALYYVHGEAVKTFYSTRKV
ncbi:hypothetical protein NECID01_1054 [Nematocida sp. AWRm77]|nr:hypothetical protein NECID01_1054 [Nematocida sp. AWRm77]